MDVARRSPARLAHALPKRCHVPTRHLSILRPLHSTWTDNRTRRTPATTRPYATAPPGDVAVIGGGMAGLTAAYYLARRLPASSRLTLYEGAEELGGWVHTNKREAPGGGVVHFEKGPRMLRGLGKTGFRGDDYVFYDLVRPLPVSVVGRARWCLEKLASLTRRIDLRPQAPPEDISTPPETLLLQQPTRPPPPSPDAPLPGPHSLAAPPRHPHPKRHVHRRPPLPPPPPTLLPPGDYIPRRLDRRLAAHELWRRPRASESSLWDDARDLRGGCG